MTEPSAGERIDQAVTEILDALDLTTSQATHVSIEAGRPIIVTVGRVELLSDGTRRGYEQTYEVHR